MEVSLSRSDFAVPSDQRWFEDFVPGAVYEFGHMEVDEAEIVEFARRFDPQPMHIDAQTAALGPFEGLIASGWQTAGLMMRMFVENFLPGHASLASPGIDELRWPHPVRPGDVLHLRVTVIEATRSRSKPDRGMLRTFIEVLNQNSDVVMTLKPMNLVRCRSPIPSAPPQAGEN